MLGRQEADSTGYLVECAPGYDMRKPLFALMAKNGCPIIGMEAQGLNLEDVFLSAVEEEKPDGKIKGRKRGR